MREHLKEPRRPPKSKKIEKERGSNTTILFTTLVLVSPTLHCREFSCCFSSITMWGINVIELGLYIPRMSLLKWSRSSRASKLDAPPLVPLESFHTLIALCASVAWRSLLLIQCQLRDFLLSCGYLLHCLSLSFWPSKPPLLFSLP